MNLLESLVAMSKQDGMSDSEIQMLFPSWRGLPLRDLERLVTESERGMKAKLEARPNLICPLCRNSFKSFSKNTNICPECLFRGKIVRGPKVKVE